MKPTTLTKTRFVQAIECPRKLVCATDECYYNASKDDDFLEALAQGGYLAGSLAKLIHPETQRSLHGQSMTKLPKPTPSSTAHGKVRPSNQVQMVAHIYGVVFQKLVIEQEHPAMRSGYGKAGISRVALWH